jgi:hypothetical protein
MGFLDSIGNWAEKAGKDFVNDLGLATAMSDLASVTTNDKNWAGDAFQLLGNTFKATTAGATYIPRKVGGAVLGKAVMPVFEASYKAGGAAVREPLSAAITGLATMGDFQESWKQRKEISIGQAIAYMNSRFDPTATELRGDFNIFDANDREIFDTNWRYRTISGAYDTFFTTVTDPLGKIGKAAGLARKALITQPMGAVDANASQLAKDLFLPKAIRGVTIISPQTLATKINEGRDIQGGLNNTLEWFAANNSKTIRNHPMIAASNDADTMSYLLGEAKTVDDVADTLLAISNKDTEAMVRLVDKRKDLAFVMDKLKPVSQVDKQIADNIPTNGIVEDANILDAADALVKLADQDPYIQYLNKLSLKGADLTKRTFGASMAQKGAIREAERKTARALGEQPSPTAYPTIGIFQPTKYHPMVAIINFAERWSGERPAGWFNNNDSDSFNEIKAFGGMLRRIVGDSANVSIAEHYDLFIKAGDIPEARGLVAESFEDLAVLQVNKALGISDETAAIIWNAYKGRRKVALDSLRDRKYLMTNDDVILKIPYAERQGINAKPMVDLENYARVLTENKGLIQAIEGSQGIVDPDVNRYVMGLLNDVWKASVLLRLGYTVRNTAEATASILAKGYGLVAAADVNKESIKNWYDNRIIGIERLTDKNLVKKGVREDSVALRNEMTRVQSERAQINSLNQEIDSQMEAVELAFKRGKLTEQQAIEFLEISSYRSGEILHHGSPSRLTSLNPNRPLAMTYSDDIANQYAEAGIKVISASTIYKRLTGRAYTMPKNLRNREGELIREGGVRKPSKAMQTIASDMRDGFRNSIAKGNRVELLSIPSGTWRAVDPDTISQKMLLEGQFRIVKPGNQGQVVTSRVYGTPVDLRTFSGSRVRLGLNDYPELKALGLDIRKPDSWKGKEKELLEWMRDNNVGKLTLPDTKANGRATVLVDPKMVQTATQDPAANLARKRVETIRNTEALRKDESRIMDILRSTIDNKGGTFGLQTGAVPRAGYSVAVRGATWQLPLDDAIADSAAARESLIQHIEDNLNKFEGADHFGTWIAPNDNGVLTIWAEPVNVIKDRAKAVKIGTSRNQQAVADLDRIAQGDMDNAFINTGGTGDEGASAGFALGQVRKASAGDVTSGAQSVRRGFSRPSYSQSTSELADLIADGKYPADGIINLVRELADRGALTKAKHENLMQRLDARIVEEGRLNAPKKRIGTGTYTQKLYDGTVIEHPDAAAGELGDILMQRTDNADTYRLMADAPSQLFTARYGGMEEIRLSPNDPRYFTGYANYLNNLWRSPNENKIDPIIQKFLDNETPEQVVRWLRKTDEGKAYSTKMSIDDRAFKVPSERLNVGTDAEDFVGNLYSAYARMLPDVEIQEAFRNNLIDEMYLRTHFADQPAMPDIIGSVIPQAPGIQGAPGAAQAFVQKAFYFLGSLPETTLARHPLARAVYRAEMRQRGDIALSLKRSQLDDPKAELTLDEINALRKDAVEGARREVNKTLFTIMRKSYAGEKMRYLMPFFNAWENTMRRWTTLAKENPAAIARAGQITSSLSNQNNYVDKDGNPSKEFSYDSRLVLPMPETFMKTMEAVPGGKGLASAIRSAGSQVSIPIRSLDVMFQGEVHPGFGPVVAIPAQYLEILRPDLEGILKQVIPFGAAESPMKTLLPPALQKAAQLWSGTRDGSWSRTFNTVYRYELIKYRLGDRETEPTFKEINDLTNNMYKVKALSNLVLPFAAQYDSPLGWYTQQYRKLQQTYGSQADALFLQMYPEMGEATISASLNNTGVDATQAAVANLKKYNGLISKIGSTTPEMIGFLVNDPDGKYDFSQAAYRWQMRNSPVPGSTTNFRGQRDPSLLKQDAQKKMGWIDYRKAMDFLDQQLFAQGYTSYSERGAEELNLAKQAYTQQLATNNKDWAADFYSVDKGKWIYRMQTINTILRDPQWMQDNGNKPVVGAIATYYVTRTQIARELANRKASGASGTLTAADNADLEGLWNQTIATLKQESLEFSSFYNRFLQNDPVTLG